jgi:hypothetical protein
VVVVDYDSIKVSISSKGEGIQAHTSQNAKIRVPDDLVRADEEE